MGTNLAVRAVVEDAQYSDNKSFFSLADTTLTALGDVDEEALDDEELEGKINFPVRATLGAL